MIMVRTLKCSQCMDDNINLKSSVNEDISHIFLLSHFQGFFNAIIDCLGVQHNAKNFMIFIVRDFHSSWAN